MKSKVKKFLEDPDIKKVLDQLMSDAYFQGAEAYRDAAISTLGLGPSRLGRIDSNFYRIVHANPLGSKETAQLKH